MSTICSVAYRGLNSDLGLFDVCLTGISCSLIPLPWSSHMSQACPASLGKSLSSVALVSSTDPPRPQPCAFPMPWAAMSLGDMNGEVSPGRLHLVEDGGISISGKGSRTFGKVETVEIEGIM